MFVPEGRHEVTTEGGLDIVAQEAQLKDAVARLADQGIVVSVFIDADVAQVEAAARIGAKVCEIPYRPYAHAFHAAGRDAESPAVLAEIARIAEAGAAVQPRHALQRRARPQLLQRPAHRPPPGIRELHIGHSIISRSVFVGLREAVREMKRLMREGAERGLRP